MGRNAIGQEVTCVATRYRDLKRSLANAIALSLVLRTIRGMGECTAPKKGHRTASGRAACPGPDCGGSSSNSPQSYSTPVYGSATSSSGRAWGGSSSINWSDRTSEVGAASSGTDLLVWVVFLDAWDGTFTLWRAIFGLLLLGLPFAIGALVLSKCGAWLNDGSRRCKQPRSGFLRRCFDHRSQTVTGYDVWGGLSIAIGVLNVVLLILALSGGS